MGSWRRREQRVAREVALPAGYFVEWSGRWQNQEHARQQLQVVLPIVLLVIFVLLYFTYHSAVEAAHVLLAVPFALTGGVYLLWLLGYNFSVAVWVGFIALFGTAVQTGVVMVIYLEEAVARKRQQLGGTFTRADLRDAVVEGALLRLRPKVMTVSTVVAGLLPIMWSTRVGAEVMKPLATPVLGGMISSLIHVLDRHARHLLLASGAATGPSTPNPSPAPARPTVRWRPALIAPWPGWCCWSEHSWCGGAIALPAIELARPTPGPRSCSACSPAICRLWCMSPTGTLRQGRNTFTIEFRRPSGALVDVGTVTRQRQHVDAGHGHARRTPTHTDRCPWPLSGHRRVRDGGRVADGLAVERTSRTGIGHFRRDGAMTTRVTLIAVGQQPRAQRRRCFAQTTPLDQPAGLASKYVDPASGLDLRGGDSPGDRAGTRPAFRSHVSGRRARHAPASRPAAESHVLVHAAGGAFGPGPPDPDRVVLAAGPLSARTAGSVSQSERSTPLGSPSQTESVCWPLTCARNTVTWPQPSVS